MRTFHVAVVAGLIGISGCSSPDADSTAAPPAATSAPVTPAGLAAKLGCEPSTIAPTMYAREEATCGDSTDTTWRDIVTFSDTTNRDQWVQAAESFGGVFVVGDRWAVSVNDQASAEAVKAKLGGEVR